MHQLPPQVRRRSSLLVPGVLLCLAPSCNAQPQSNLVPDASFEARMAPLWSALPAKSTYIEKEAVATAADGASVLVLQGWDKAGSKVLSPPLAITGDTFTATAKVRSIAATEGAEIEVAFFDAQGTQKLATFGKSPLNSLSQWKEIGGTGKLAAPATQGRLGFIISGPQRGVRVEVDAVGLFSGQAAAEVTNNVSWNWFEAEELADGTAWKVQDHYRGWYSGLPSGSKMLIGPHKIDDQANRPVTKSLPIRIAGPHRLWVRFLNPSPTLHGKFTIALQQNGKTVVEKEITESDKQYGEPYTWAWTSLDAELSTGDVDVVLKRPAASASHVTRKVDLFALTNLLDYKPAMDDFKSRGFVRFINKSTGVEPFTLWWAVRRHEPPLIYVTPGILSSAGLSESHYVPTDREKWLYPGEVSPWVDIQKYLLPATGRNNVQLIATRDTRSKGLVREPIRGTLEFAVGPERRVVKRIEIDQSAPRVLLALPDDFENATENIRTPLDFIKKAEEVIDKIGQPQGRTARHLDLSAILSLDAELDDPEVVEREIKLLKRLGFNNLYNPIADPAKALAFNEKHGLQPQFGTTPYLWYHLKNNCQNQPDIEKMNAVMKEHADKHAPIADKIIRTKMADEPSAMKFEHIVGCDFCKKEFAADLKAEGLAPAQLGVETWEQAVPVLPANREKQPELFYHTAMFRLRSFAELARTCTQIKNKYFPTTAKSYVNYVPPHSEYVDLTTHGSDPFLAQRSGALEMGWTEDWLGYGASPQQVSDQMAMMRAAVTSPGTSQSQPLGGYMVGVSGGALLQRLKYYGMVAGGAEQVNVYHYGPHYSGIDDWSPRYEIYPVISAVQHELGRIDAALEGTQRRKSDIAILYNRTASIWANRAGTAQQDVRLMRWALSHAGYDADFIPEEDVEAGHLAQYKVLYLSGPQVRRATASKIAEWVQNGGVLFGNAGAGSRDEFDRPLDTLEEVFGAKSENLKLENNSGRPKYELRTLPVLDVLTTVAGSGAPAVTFNQLSFRERLVPTAKARIILRNKAGDPAGVLHTFGRGQAIRVAAMPGTTYLNDAVHDKAYDIESYLPRNYRTELRDFIVWPAVLGKAARTAQASTPITEVVRYDATNRAVVFVIDHNAELNPTFTMTLPHSGQFQKAYSASGKPVTLKRLGDNALQVSLPLNVADAVVLE